jgi:peptidoglycan-N-acetylglucosamine deacetylase
VPLHRRQVLGLAGAALAGSSAARWLLADSDSDPQAEAEAPDEEDIDEEVEDPQSGLQRLIWSVQTDQPLAALTFDDGPHPRLTPPILETLDRYGIKATFMAMGYAAQRYPRLMDEVVAAGHEVGHHTWRHKNLADTNVKVTRDEIDLGVRLVEEAAGTRVRLFRPPRGRLSEAAVRLVAKHRHDIVLWSVTRGPLGERSPRRVADHLVNSVNGGDIIDLHDGIGRGTFNRGEDFAEELMDRRLTEVEALPRFIEGLADRGVRLGTVSDLMAVRTLTEV